MDFNKLNGGVKLVVNTVREVQEICYASTILSSTVRPPSNDSRGASEVEDFRQSLKQLKISSYSFISTGRNLAEHVSNENQIQMIAKDDLAPERMSRKLKRYLRIIGEYSNQLHRHIGDLQPEYTKVYELTLKHSQRTSTTSAGITARELIRILPYVLLFCGTISSLMHGLYAMSDTRFLRECQPVARRYCYTHEHAKYHNECERENVMILKEYRPTSYCYSHEITSKLCTLERVSHLTWQNVKKCQLKPYSVCFYESKLYTKERSSQCIVLKECQPKSYCYGLALINDSLLYSLKKLPNLNRSQCLDHEFTAEYYNEIYYLMNFTQYQPSINYCYRLILNICSQTLQILKHIKRFSIMTVVLVPLPAVIAMVSILGNNNRVEPISGSASDDEIQTLQYDISEFLDKVQKIKDQLLLFEQCAREMSVCVEHIAADELSEDIEGQLKQLQMEIQPILSFTDKG